MRGSFLCRDLDGGGWSADVGSRWRDADPQLVDRPAHRDRGGAADRSRDTGGSALRTGIAAAFVLILPIDGYHRILERMTTPDRPLSVIGECAAKIRGSGVAVGEGFYNAAALVADHPYYYYLRHVGPWLLADHASRRSVAAAPLRRGRADADRPVAEGLRTAHRACRRVVDGARRTSAADGHRARRFRGRAAARSVRRVCGAGRRGWRRGGG